MKKLVYAKFNNTRKPVYQMSTCIYETDGKRQVVKKPLQLMGYDHMKNFQRSYELLGDYYKEIKLIKPKMGPDSVIFEFIKGEKIYNESRLLSVDIETMVSELKDVIRLILNINKKYLTNFVVTDEFIQIFGNPKQREEQAVSICNLDCILDNFIRKGENVYCLDYEWVFEFPIPIRFLIFRSLFFFYHSNCAYLSLSLVELLSRFDFSKEDCEYYWSLEDHFQDYVHGLNRECIYTKNYEKNVISFKDMTNKLLNMDDQIKSKDNHIQNLEDIIKNREEVISALNHIVKEKGSVQNESKYDKFKRWLCYPFNEIYMLGKSIVRKILPYSLYRALQVIVFEGVYVFAYKLKDRSSQSNDYEKWIISQEKAYSTDDNFSYNPKISVLVPVYNVTDKQLRECIDSVKNQIYTNWELCLADDCSTWESVRKTLRSYEGDSQIKIDYRNENGHISRCTNSAMAMADGEYIAFLDCDDILRPNALFEVVKKLNENPKYDYIYSDEDKINDNGKNRHMPHFKPDWSPDTLMMQMYSSHLSVYRRSIANMIGGLRPGYEGAQDYDFTLRFTEKTDRIAHIPKILYHWRERKESTSIDISTKPYILEAAQKTKREALKRRGLEGKLEFIKGVNQYRIKYTCKENYLISIIIPSKDNYSIAKRCIDTLFNKTKYKNFEVIIVDNGSNEENKYLYETLCKQYLIQYHYKQMSFNFSKMCNIGASLAKGKFYLFLNDDVEIIEEEWLERMLGQAALSHTGAVGAKLLYPNGNLIQHIGVISIENGPIHCLSGYDDKNMYYFARNKIDYNYSAVTAACLMVDRVKYNEVKGFDEELSVAYNDVDFCFKLVEKGFYNIVRNDVVLYHHESISRGDDLASKKKMERLMREQEKLYEKHPNFYKRDPFYNPNLAQNKADFSYNYGLIRFENKTEEIRGLDSLSLAKDKLVYAIDQVLVSDQIRIIGWAFLKNKRFNNLKKVKLILKDNSEKVFLIETNKVYRPDVAEAFGNKKKLNFIGFECFISHANLESDKYRLGLVIEKKYVLTDTVLNV